MLPCGRGIRERRRNDGRFEGMKQKKEMAEKKRPDKLNLCKMLCMTEEDFMEVANEFYTAVDKYKNNLDIGRYMIASRGQNDKKSFAAGFCFGRYVQRIEDARAIFGSMGFSDASENKKKEISGYGNPKKYTEAETELLRKSIRDTKIAQRRNDDTTGGR
jgi:hypothetical protein